MRLAKSFMIERDLSEYVDATKGESSASERVNELLRRAMIQERCEQLEAEAVGFSRDARAERDEARAMQKASLLTFGRD